MYCFSDSKMCYLNMCRLTVLNMYYFTVLKMYYFTVLKMSLAVLACKELLLHLIF